MFDVWRGDLRSTLWSVKKTDCVSLQNFPSEIPSLTTFLGLLAPIVATVREQATPVWTHPPELTLSQN